jgi:hypothetical protein
MSLEQYDWLERKGVEDVHMYDFYKQDATHVYLKRRDIGLVIRRRKDMVGWLF